MSGEQVDCICTNGVCDTCYDYSIMTRVYVNGRAAVMGTQAENVYAGLFSAFQGFMTDDNLFTYQYPNSLDAYVTNIQSLNITQLSGNPTYEDILALGATGNTFYLVFSNAIYQINIANA